MEDIASIILKYDGYIWGSWTWYKVGGHEMPTTIRCRFVSKSLFTPPDFPVQFLIDLKQNFTFLGVKNGVIKLKRDDKEYCVLFSLNSPATELAFIDNVDFSCNLLDLRRDGFYLRGIPGNLALEMSPYETVVNHIKTKTLYLCSPKGIKTAGDYLKFGWKCQDKPNELTIMKYSSDEDCSICHAKLSNTCLKTRCGHIFHQGCISKWTDTGITCPMCRDPL